MSAQQQFLQDNASKPGVVVTSSGLQYKIDRDAEGAKPTSSDAEVEVHYKGMLIDGTVFDSSYDRGEPLTFFLNQVIAGWSEGVQLMPEGSKFTFYIPSELGYGARGVPGVIPANATLVFEVELLKVWG